MTSSTAPDSKLTTPYPPWPTVKGFLEELAATVVPTHVDHSLMTKMSGTARSQVRGALRFLNLIEDDGSVRAEMRELVSALGKDTWPHALFSRLTTAYEPVVGALDVSSATLGQLVDRFRSNGNVTGSALRKAVRFYLAALGETAVKMSPHLKGRGLNALASGERGTRPRSPKSEREEAAPRFAPPPPTPPAAVRTDEFLIQLPGRAVMGIPLPEDLSMAEWDYIDRHVRSYMELRDARKQSSGPKA